MAEFQPPEGLRPPGELINAIALKMCSTELATPIDVTHGFHGSDKPCQWCLFDAGRALAALFEACEVREEWGVRSVVPDRGIPDYWRENRAQAEDTIAARSALGAHVRSSLIHRCALKTPVEVITPPVSSTGEEKTDG